jgi:hypothetical protein
MAEHRPPSAHAGVSAPQVDGAAPETYAEPGPRTDPSAKPRRPAFVQTTAAAETAWWTSPSRARARLALWSTSRGAFDTAICVVYLCLAAWLTHNLWPDPSTRAIAQNVNDQTLIEWFLGHGVLVWTGDFSLLTTRLNSPDGVNLMSNASHILHGVIMAPVTVLFGAAVSFALLVALNLAATAAGWYLLLARGLKLNRGAAIVGGLFAGFAPGMISQSNSHLHMTAQWLVPPIVWFVILLTRVTTARDTVVTSLGLSVLICAQVFLGEEVLYLTALTLGLFGLVYSAMRWRWAKAVAPRFLAGLGLAAVVSGLTLAYPLWFQFSGPRHTPNAPFPADYYFADIASYLVFSPLSIAGSEDAGRLASSHAELNTYFGLPLLVVLLGCVIWSRRSAVVTAASATSIVMIYLSFGPYLTLNTERTGWPSLYGNIAEVPVIDGALPTRYALALIPLVGVILAITFDAAVRAGGLIRVAVPTAIVAALLPMAPLPLEGTDRVPVPEFITSGAWRQCAPEGGVIVPVPLPTPMAPDPMRWAAAANGEFGMPEGFFLGAYGAEGRTSVGTYKQPTSAMLEDVARTGTVPEITDETRAQARRDLAFWRADCVVLAHGPNEVPLRTTLESLLGPGTAIADTWTWPVKR